MAEKKAVKRVVRGDDGRRRVILVDIKTYQEVTDPSGYTIINANSSYEEPVASIETPEIPSISPENTKEKPVIPNSPEGQTAAQGVKNSVTAPSKSTTQGAPVGAVTRSPIDPIATPPANPNPTPGVAGPKSGSIGVNPAQGTPGAKAPESKQAGPSLDAPKGVATPETAGKSEPGKGLANLSDSSKSGMASVNNSGLGPGRSAPADEALMGIIAEEVGRMFGPEYSIDVTSGTYTDQQRADIAAGKRSETGSSRHTHGKAADFSVTGPDGKALSYEQMTNLAEALAGRGITGIGLGKGYMDADGTSRMHADMSRPGQPLGWGAKGRSKNMDPALSGRLGKAWSEGKFSGPATAPTPTPNPGPPTTSNPMEDTNQGVGKGMVDATKDPGTMTPAELSRTQFGPSRTPEEMAAMGKAIAGELGPNTLKGLSEGSLEAMQEMSNIIATMENRAQSQNNKSGSMLGVLGGGSYNSMMGSKSKTTNDNFSKFGEAVMKGIEDFYSGKPNMTPTNPKATHYYNPDIVDPKWGKSLEGAGRVGSHTFGSLPGEFAPGKSFQEGLAQAAGPSRNTPSEKGGRFGGSGLGYSGFGNDTPSENGPGPGAQFGQGVNMGSTGTPASFSNSSSESGPGPGMGQGVNTAPDYGGWGGPGEGAGHFGGSGLGYGGPGDGVGGGPGMGGGQSYGGPGEGVGGGPGMGGGQNYGGPGEGVGGGPGMGAGQNYGGPGEGVGGGPGMGAGQNYGGPGEGVGGGPGGPNGTGGPGHGIGWV